jgi:hypothetical protein
MKNSMLTGENPFYDKKDLNEKNARVVQYLNEALDKNSSLEEMIEYLKKLIDKADEDVLKNIILQFKKERIESLVARAIAKRGIKGVKIDQAQQSLAGVLQTVSASVTELSAFLKKVVKGDFGIEEKLKVGIYDFSDIIPTDDPIMSQIWERLYNDTKALTSGITSSGKGEFLLMVLGGRTPLTKDGEGGDLTFGSTGCEIKLPGGQIWARSTETVYRDELHAGVVQSALSIHHSDIFNKKEAAAFGEKYKTSSKSVYFFTDLMKHIKDKGGDKQKAMAVTASVAKSIYNKHYDKIKPVFYNCISSKNLSFNTEKFQKEMIIVNLDLYKSIKKWKYMILFNSRSAVTKIAIIESSADIKSGKIPYELFDFKKGPENLIFYTAPTF